MNKHSQKYAAKHSVSVLHALIIIRASRCMHMMFPDGMVNVLTLFERRHRSQHNYTYDCDCMHAVKA